MNQKQTSQQPTAKNARFGDGVFKPTSLRSRLLLAFITLTILPVFITGTAASLVSAQGLRNDVFDELQSVAVLKENAIKEWLNVVQTNLGIVYEDVVVQQGFSALLQNNPDQALDQNQLRNELISFNNRTGYFVEIFVMNTDGEIVLSTDTSQEGKIQPNQAFFQKGLDGKHVSPPAYEVSLSSYSIIISEPVKSSGGNVIGVLAGRVNLSTLSDIMQQQTGLGDAGETYLISSNYAVLTSLKHTELVSGETYIRTNGATNAIQSKTGGIATYTDYAGNATFGVYHWIPELQIALIAEHDQADALQASNRVLVITIGLTVITALLAILIAFIVTGGITSPITKLVDVANSIAQGNLTLKAEVTSRDEISILAQAFNTMTERLRDLFDALEQRVAERTKALETSAEISRRLTSILDPRELANEVVNQIQSSYNYYYVQIYLYDDTGENLVLTAGTGEAGKGMLERGHSLPKGRGLVGRAATNKESVLVSDTSQASDWLPNELLPDTKAEAVVPIFIGDQVLGVLDVQDNATNDITEGDITLLESIASQVAISLQNAESYARADTALQEARSLVENASEGIAVLDLTTGFFTEANENAEKLYELSHDELMKMGPGQLSPPTQPDGRDSNEKAMEQIGIAMEKGTNVFEWVHINGQGEEFPAEIRLVRMPGDYPRVRVTVIDITERQNLQKLTAQRARQQEAINLITQRIQSTTTIEEALQVAARELGHAVGQKQTVVTLVQSTLDNNSKADS